MNKIVRIFAKTANIWRGLAALFLALMIVVAFLSQLAFANRETINSFLQLPSSEQIKLGDAEPANYYPSEFAKDVKHPTTEEFNALKEASKQHSIQEMEEGAVLLTNKDIGNGEKALPLNDGAKVTLFGYGSEYPLYKPASGSPDTKPVDVITAMKDAGFEVNQTIYDAYRNARNSGSYGSGNRPDWIGNLDWSIYEPEKAFYDQAGIRDSYKDYNDAAVVFITRTAGEHRDCPTGRDGLDVPGLEDRFKRDYLELTQNEKDMLTEVNEHFDRIILVLNTANIFQVGWLDEYNIDACLYTAGYGNFGSIGMANILAGKANPSGRTVDTWAYDFESAPAMTNFGNFSYVNADEQLQKGMNGITENMDMVEHYVVYAEGIYVGYKYYETRYEDTVLNQGGASSGVGATNGTGWVYEDEVQFPFGYGLSYTTFTQEIVEGKYDENAKGKEFTFTVNVHNDGNVAGKCSVPIYVQAPYKDGGVEKSSALLVGFNKTPIIQPGKTESITITVDKYLLASYDETAHNGNGGYILDSGSYYFAVGDSVHDALNNILATKGAKGMVNVDGSAFNATANKVWKWELGNLDDTTYRYSADGEEIKNRFVGDYAIDINEWVSNSVKYLSRSDWANTYPVEPAKLTVTGEMAKVLSGYFYDESVPEDAPSFDSFTQGAENGISFVSMYGVDYDDPIWEDFIDQLTIDEMISIIPENWGSVAVTSVNMPSFWNDDGPDGVNGGFKIFETVEGEDGETVNKQLDNINGECTLFPNETILACTFNPELITRRGELIGEETMFATCPQLWSPGANIHRTPYSGRNFEYYSECSNMSYLCASIEVKAMRDKGVVTAIKHCCGNDQETNRQGVATFAQESAFRMGSMRGFEGAFTVGKGNSTMTAFNRVGLVAFPHNKVMQEEIMRGEWGFRGVIISDMIAAHMHPSEGLISGNDMWCLAGLSGRTDQIKNELKARADAKDGFFLENLRRSAKNFFYAYANSNITNGLSVDTVIRPVTNWWEYLLDDLNVALMVVSIVFAVLFVGSSVTKSIVARKDKSSATKEADNV